MSDDLLMAILAMDSYNRTSGPSGSAVGLAVAGSQIGAFTISDKVDIGSASFYAQSYIAGGEVVISYRGTDSPYDIPAWVTGIGAYTGAQPALAAEFYRAIKAANSNANITLTGHSLGGGLAGLVGSIYGVDGVLFANMAFELASQRLHDNSQTTIDPNSGLPTVLDHWARDEFYGGSEPSDIDRSGLHTVYVAGEALTANRVLQETEKVELNVETSWGDAVQRHSQSLLVILQFAKDLAGVGAAYDADKAAWHDIADYLLPSLFSQEIAIAAGSAAAAGTSTSDEKMRTMIAYSALGSGERPYGDTGIRSLFNDANELAKVLRHADEPGVLTNARQYLVQIVIPVAIDCDSLRIGLGIPKSMKV